MEFDITHSPSFSKLDIRLNKDEVVRAQPDSMLTMTPGLRLTAQVGGTAGARGVMGGIKGLVSGESFFTAVYTARTDGAQLSLVPDAIGEIVGLTVSDAAPIMLSSGSFLASEGSVNLDARFAGVKGWMAQKGFFLLRATGTGSVFISSYGAVIRRDLAVEEQLIVDNRYVLAFTEGMKFELVTAARELSDALMSGEGLVNRYTGPGTLYYQTRARPRRTGMVSTLLQMAT